MITPPGAARAGPVGTGIGERAEMLDSMIEIGNRSRRLFARVSARRMRNRVGYGPSQSNQYGGGSCKTPRSAAPDGLRAGVFVSEPSRTASGQA